MMAGMKSLSLYEQRLARLFDFLREHYAHAPDVFRLAEEAHVSPWHFHRLYHQLMGETLQSTVRWMRLHRAAWLLSNSDRPVAAVARECGYQGNAQSFARAFRRMYGMTPHQYRQQPVRDYTAEIVGLAAVPLLGLVHTGDYQRMGESYAKLEAFLRLRGLMPEAPRVFALLRDDPDVVAAEDLRSVIAVAGEGACEPPLVRDTVRAGRYALVYHHGATAEVDRVFAWLCKSWLPRTGLRADEGADAVIEFVSAVRGAPPSGQLCAVYVPLCGDGAF